MAAPPPRGAPAAREALLPAAAHRGRAAARRRGAAHPGGRRPSGWPRSASPTRQAALRHLEALTSGVTRTANIQRHAAAGDARLVRRGARPGRRAVRLPPDQRVAGPDAVVPQDPARRGPGRRAAGPAARHLALRHRPARARAAGRPDAGGGPRAARPPSRSSRRCSPSAGRRDDPEEAVRAIRAVRRRELFRIAAGDLLGLIDVADVGRRRCPGSPTRPWRPRCGWSLESVARAPAELDAAPTRMAIVAMGRYGGFELSYGSDADVLFVHEPERRRRPARGLVVRQGRRQRAAPAARAARRRPAARGRRRPAPRGQAGAAGAQPGLATRPTTRSGRRSGRRRRCCGPTRSSATRTCGAGSRS